MLKPCATIVIVGLFVALTLRLAAAQDAPPVDLDRFFHPPAEFVGAMGTYRSPLNFDDGRPVANAYQWSQRRRETLDRWNSLLGPWPALIERPAVEILDSQPREHFIQHRVRVQVAPQQMLDGYLLVPTGDGPFPAVVVPYYDPETSVGLKGDLRDFALQLTRRGFVSLSIGSPGGDARKPDLAGANCQPLSYLGYIAANCYNALAQRRDVDPRRIGIVGHSYGGKWALFGSCLYDKFACAAWSDPGIVFDEARGSVNYWEPWYLGLDANRTRKPGLVTPDNPRTGPYAALIEQGHDLHELHALMAPRPFLVSGGSEDFPARWTALNHTLAVNEFLGVQGRVAMTNRPAHPPTAESNDQIYAFFERFLQTPRADVVAIAHRGLLRDAPENTLPNFAACLDVHFGFEFDVRRSRDGVLVCVHDDTLDRTTDGHGAVANRTLAELQTLDAGGWFSPEFRSVRVPTIDEVLALVAAHPASAGIYAVDLKAADERVEADVVRLAEQHGVLDRLLFIGRAIDQAGVRRRLRSADEHCHVAALANDRDDLSAAIGDADSDWVYVRFVPTVADVTTIRAGGKKTIIAGPTVAGLERTNWSRARAAGVD
ncbi:MAG TPA: glycerophosphodiester phosphodiesterase family protein, partial [Pirellulales bacterium]|nr:glycerophosphodiester phosphodiesterase family protein [Pirellulales bacterium]